MQVEEQDIVSRQKANVRERGRVRAMRKAYHNLASYIPIDDSEVKLSQLDVISRAKDFIRYLQERVAEKHGLEAVHAKMFGILEARYCQHDVTSPATSAAPTASSFGEPVGSDSSSTTTTANSDLAYDHLFSSLDAMNVETGQAGVQVRGNSDCSTITFSQAIPMSSDSVLNRHLAKNAVAATTATSNDASSDFALSFLNSPIQQQQQQSFLSSSSTSSACTFSSQAWQSTPSCQEFQSTSCPNANAAMPRQSLLEPDWLSGLGMTSPAMPPSTLSQSTAASAAEQSMVAASSDMSDNNSNGASRPVSPTLTLEIIHGFQQHESRRKVEKHRVRINKRLRQQSRCVREGIDMLRDRIPVNELESHLSTGDVLRRASEYIAFLNELSS